MRRIYEFFKRKREENASGKWISRLIFIGLGVSATLWFLIRVIPKPVRATYPCMQAVSPFMSAFVIYLLSLWGGITAFRKAKQYILQKKIGLACLSLSVLLVGTMVFASNNISEVFAQDVKKEKAVMMLEPNVPKGEAKGINPGRVAWAYAPGAAQWDGNTGFWFEDKWNNQDNCDWLVSQSLLSLTGKEKESEAWKVLFESFNQTKRNLTQAYKPGEKIAIKINQNNTYSHQESEELNASPHITLSLLRSLINEGGVPQENITILEPSRFITDFFYNKCSSEFPKVKFVDNSGGDGRIQSSYIDNAIPYSKDNGKLATGLESNFKEADYVINMALLKGHVGQGVTLCGKNWYGVTSIHADWRKNAHVNFDQDRKGNPKYLTFVDYMGHKYLGDKTMLYFIDGLYGSMNVAGKPSGKWNMAPFNNDWPCSLFASQDPVAIDAVGVDFISSEWPNVVDIDYADMYLLEAALADKPLSGTAYDPERDGTTLASLGVVEHWNNPVEKKYSRNLGKSEGIELVLNKK